MSLFKTLPPLPLDAPALEELRALPVEPGTWVGVRWGHHGSRGRAYFEICAWVDLDRQVVRAACGVPVGKDAQALPGLLVEALRNPDLETTPARPTTVACDLHQEGVQLLAQSLGCMCVQDEYGFEGSEVLERDQVEATASRYGVTYLLRDKLAPALVKKLFQAAARCWTKGLWRTHAPDTVIRIDGLGKSPVHACIIPRGLVICGSDKSLKNHFKGSRERAPCQNRYLVLRRVRAHAAGSALFA